MFGKNIAWKKIVPAVLVLGIAIVATGCAGSGTAAVPAGSAPLNTITVVGYGEAIGAPDIAQIELGIDVTNADVGEAISQNNERMSALTEALTGAGVAAEDIQTTGFNVWPEDRYDPQGQPTGERVYHVQNVVRVKVRDLTKLGGVIEAALDAGANQVYGLSFTIDDPTELENAAREDAVADARARAEKLAEALGMRVGKAIIVNEGGFGGGPVYYPVDRVGGGGAGGEGVPPISGGQLTITSSVTITFELVP